MSDITTAQVTARGYRAHGIELPAGAQRAFDAWDAMQETLNAQPGMDARRLGEEYLAGERDDLGDAVRDLAVLANAQAGIQALINDAARPIGLHAYGAMLADADRVTGLLAERYLSAAQAIVGALDHFDAHDYADRAAAVIGRSSATAVAYHAAREASETLAGIRLFVASLRPVAAQDMTPHLIRLAGDATAATVPAAERAVAAGGVGMWLELFAVPGVVPALNTTEQAEEVRRRAVQLETTEANASRAVAARASRQGWPAVSVP
jgi:hypothetical protein